MNIKVNEIVDKYGDYEVDEEKLKEILVEPRPKSVRDLKEGDKYYFINDSGIVDFQFWDNMGYEHNNRNLGNIFLTRREAKFEMERRKVEAILLKYGRRTFNPFPDGIKATGNYMIIHSIDEIGGIDRIMIDNVTRYVIGGVIYFDTEKLCQQAMQEAGINNIKKYLFGVSDDAF